MVRRVLIDCPENIPCNPCEYACKQGAIYIGKEIVARPQINLDLCTGCGNCIVACPGQACFVIDEDFSLNEATIDFPYEYLPLPKIGEEVMAVNNLGEEVCGGKVLKVINNKSYNETAIVRIAVKKDQVKAVRGMMRKLKE